MSLKDIKYTFKGHISGFLRFLLVAFLVMLQIAFIISLSLMMSRNTIYYYFFLELFSLIVILVLVNNDISPSYKIAWIAIVLIFPLSGHIMYVLWGNSSISKKLTRKIMDHINYGLKYNEQDKKVIESFDKEYPQISRMSKYMRKENFPLYRNNNVTYYPMGEAAFDAMIRDFEDAKEYILINFYIIAEGKLWDRIHKVLKKKIDEGIEVYLLYDDFGVMLRTGKDFEKKLRMEGFKIRVFNPIHKYMDKLYMNYRSHQKVVVIDGKAGYTGGLNIGDEYANIFERFGVWKDTAVRIEGDAVRSLIITFLQMWSVTSDKDEDYNKFFRSNTEIKTRNYCHILSDGPANNPDNPIENIYLQMINYSTDYLYITTPYLIIEEDLRQALETAVKSGIDVRIITPKIPDKKTIKMLTNYNYGRLLKNGVRIFEYSKGFIHAKMIVNETSAIVGTVNMDYRSFYLHYECGAWICSPKTVGEITRDIRATIEESEEIYYEDWKKRPIYVKLFQWFANLFQTLA